MDLQTYTHYRILHQRGEAAAAAAERARVHQERRDHVTNETNPQPAADPLSAGSLPQPSRASERPRPRSAWARASLFARRVR